MALELGCGGGGGAAGAAPDVGSAAVRSGVDVDAVSSIVLGFVASDAVARKADTVVGEPSSCWRSDGARVMRGPGAMSAIGGGRDAAGRGDKKKLIRVCCVGGAKRNCDTFENRDTVSL